MPLNLAKVGLAVQSGLSAVCATCDLYWRARDHGVPGDTCLGKSCASPLGGGDFGEYRGPIVDFTRWCFVCGADATHGVRASGRERFVGICSQHMGYLGTLALERGEAAGITVLDSKGREVRRVSSSRKSLAAFIFEVETYYAEKEGRGL